MQEKEYRTEWSLLQNQFDSYEKHSLYIKLLSILVLTTSIILIGTHVFVILILLVLWLQDGIWKTFQSRIEERLLLIEGAIRIKVLLDNYDSSLSQDPRCEVFHLLFTATAQVPTHADWKALERSVRRQHEQRFSELELQHKAAARAAARWLLKEALPPFRQSA